MDGLGEKLQSYAASDALPMHMPGHKRNAAAFPWLADLGCRLDITEIDGFDDLNAPQGLFRDMEARAARLWGAEQSVCLVNGSTAGVLAAVRAALEAGGALLMARGCHRSVYHAAELAGAAVYYLVPPTDPLLGTWGPVSARAVAAALDAHPDIRLVAVTSPTYEGVMSDIAAIAAACHERGALLFVDEAHGAHLGFGGFPAGAVCQGADLVVQSLHKTLPSLTQTAVLHIQGGRIDPADVRRNAAMVQSSSPSYLLSASIDGCLRYLEAEGNAAADRWLAALERFYAAADRLRALRLWRGGGAKHDPSKLVISAAGAGIDGAALMARLRQRYRIELEMAAGPYALAMTGMGDTDASLTRLAEALADIDAGLIPAEPAPARPFVLPERRMDARAALTAPGESVPAADALGRISGEYVWAYPPGAPLIVPGEVLDRAVLDSVAGGVNIRSTRGGAPERFFVLTQGER